MVPLKELSVEASTDHDHTPIMKQSVYSAFDDRKLADHDFCITYDFIFIFIFFLIGAP